METWGMSGGTAAGVGAFYLSCGAMMGMGESSFALTGMGDGIGVVGGMLVVISINLFGDPWVAMLCFAVRVFMMGMGE